MILILHLLGTKYLGFYKIPNLLTLMLMKLTYYLSEYQWLFEMDVGIKGFH